MRFHFLSTIFSALLILQACAEQSSHTPPNIILIVADDQGWGDLGINGNPYLHTPHIDRIGSDGARFKRFYVQPVCSPTRAEILTGRYHARSGVYSTSAGGERIDLDEKLMPAFFQEAGYSTAAFGKWHSGEQPPYHPNDRGFQEFYGFCSGHWGSYFNPWLDHNGELVKGKGYLPDDLTDHLISFIESGGDQPFFAYLALNTPHSPMQVPDEWWNKIQPDAYEHRYAEAEDTVHTRAAYAMVENIDWNVGRILDYLDSVDRMENTIIVYLSDNGPNGWRWNQGLKGIKGSTDEGGIRSPLHIRWKDHIRAGIEINEIAGAIDLLPTLIGLAGLEADYPNAPDGRDLSPILLSENPESLQSDRYLFAHWRGKTSVRDQQFMLDDSGALYDLENDPGQHTALSADHADIRSKLLNARESWELSVLSELNPSGKRPFTISGSRTVRLPAADGIAHGNIIRSNRYPNSSFFTAWVDESDSITWDVEVLQPGTYEVAVYYTCGEDNTGSEIMVKCMDQQISATVREVNDPPLLGAENDRIPRQESYIKDFRPLVLGTIDLQKGKSELVLRASVINGKSALESNLVTLKKI